MKRAAADLGRDVARSVRRQARRGIRGKEPPWMRWLARIGFACRGLVYLLLAVLALGVAAGRHGSQPDEHGAFEAIAHQPLGRVLLLAVVVGFAALALWEASGAARRSRDLSRRVTQAAKTVVYLALSWSAFAVVTATHVTSSDTQVVDVTSRVMGAPGGRLLVGAVGFAVAAGGVWLLIRGLRHAYGGEIDLKGASPAARRLIDVVGVIGMSARGIVFGLTGYFLVEAAITFDPAKAKGLDGVLKSLVADPLGPWVLAAVALGLAAFGFFSILEARFARP